MLLYSDPSFIPKMAKIRLPTEPYKLRTFPPNAPPRDDALVLCPVRALKAYLEKKPDPSFVNNRETLFLLLNGTSSLNSYNISKLFADTVRCYSQSADTDLTDFHTNIHQLRNFSASLANLGRTPLEHIVLAGKWKSANMFTDLYLKSLAYFSENLYVLAPAGRFQCNRPAAGGPVGDRSLTYPLLQLAEAFLGFSV